jgi:hypothetical protein
MGLKGLRMSVEDTLIMTLDRTMIDKSRVVGLSGHALERVSGVTGVMVPQFRRVTRSVLRPKTVGMTVRAKSASRFLLCPEGRELAKGGGVATRSRCDRERTELIIATHHNFRSPAVG